MSAILERLQEQLASLQAQVNAEAQTAAAELERRHQAQLAALERDCAKAMEQAHAMAMAAAEADRLAALRIGREQERERTLLLLQLVLRQWQRSSKAAEALAALREMVEGD